MKKTIAYTLLMCCLAATLSSYAQQANTKGDEQTELQKVHLTEKMLDHRLMLVPFDPKMYMSEIDKAVARKTKMNFDQIRSSYRHSLNANVFITFKENYPILSLLSDQKKYGTDLQYIYQSISYSYDLIPNANDPQDVAWEKKHKNVHTQLQIKKGQVEVPVDYNKRFMNTVVKNPDLLPTLYRKYHTDVFVFINEIDIKDIPKQATTPNDPGVQRQITVHYSILNNKGKHITANVAVAYFPYALDDPKKIAKKCFPLIGQEIYNDFVRALAAEAAKSSKKGNASQKNGTKKKSILYQK